MGDLSAEPSMEDILSSIKRIIAEEGDPAAGRQRRQPRAATQPLQPLPPVEGGAEEVLELSDPIPPAPTPEEPRPAPARAEATPPAVTPEPIVSQQAAAASRGALDQLSRVLVKPEPGSDGTLEGLVRDMLRPMLREWLDANLPALVESMVQREIKRIVSQG